MTTDRRGKDHACPRDYFFDDLKISKGSQRTRDQSYPEIAQIGTITAILGPIEFETDGHSDTPAS